MSFAGLVLNPQYQTNPNLFILPLLSLIMQVSSLIKMLKDIKVLSLLIVFMFSVVVFTCHHPSIHLVISRICTHPVSPLLLHNYADVVWTKMMLRAQGYHSISITGVFSW